MKFFDRMREAAGVPHRSENPNLEADAGQALDPGTAEAGFEGLSGVKRALVSRTASSMLAASKKTADLLISRYRPTLMLDAILDPEDILRLIEDRGKYGQIPTIHLVVLGTNTFETLPVAREIRKNELPSLVPVFDDPSSVEAGQPFGDDSPQRLAISKLVTRESLTIVDLILECLAAIELDRVSEALTIVDKLIASDETFNHPLIARFMAIRLDQSDAHTQQALFWCRRALAYWPLDHGLLEMASRLGTPPLKKITEQIKALSDLELGDRRRHLPHVS